MAHGLGTLTAVDETKRKAIYWRDRRVCFLDGRPKKKLLSYCEIIRTSVEDWGGGGRGGGACAVPRAESRLLGDASRRPGNQFRQDTLDTIRAKEQE